ncbi:type II toxin-antitoxin system HipA family toxin [Lysobacter silvisoli]|uniref:Type II toxin-antitoxin system HipA family toxin n=1 Tax=Lysobacter silvisoli TaxID=2293254 RepID=A0A371JYK6_9GAMM|nr:type II toxin-antitoxin system HipA family toxin [Lysobacter silvisoli]RDZ26657.1 type II toxin-antitoxin system HipA family toxin [Lysobacter silvisoli]
MELWALLNQTFVGRFLSDTPGRLRFEYAPGWRDSMAAMPISLSLPLTQDRHDDPDIVSALLWGLLPDNEHTLQRWAARFQVSARNPLALLSHVGEDCAGAIQLVRPERLEALLEGRDDHKEWLSEAEVGDRLRRLKQDSGAARNPDDVGQFSLAGAQPKIALLHEDGRWAVPSGRIPTTHILKPPGSEYDGYVENEHFCLRLASRIGLPCARSQVANFDGEVAICVERYDRQPGPDGSWLRIHQEDFCQALGILPQRKYQNEGGPSPQAMASLLRQHSLMPRADVETLFLSLIFNWLIAGTDAHGKNYSLLLGENGAARLAPVYDISSALPYPQLDNHRIKMAMKVGHHYRWQEIQPRDWVYLARDMALEADFAWTALHAMARTLPDHAAAELEALRHEGVEHAVLPRLVDQIARSCERALRLLDLAANAQA